MTTMYEVLFNNTTITETINTKSWQLFNNWPVWPSC